MSIEMEEDIEIETHDFTTSGQEIEVRQPVELMLV